MKVFANFICLGDERNNLNHHTDGKSIPFTAAEFQALKKEGKTNFDLTKEFDAKILADLNKRVDAITVDDPTVMTVNTKVKLTAKERAEYQEKLAQAGQNKTALQDKPILTLIDGKTKDGKSVDADTALTRYIQQTYNPKTDSGSRRVWGDKINEMVAQAKTDGVRVDLKFNEDATALVGINAADKQKLDALFNDALGKTILGEKGSEKAQQEETGQVEDIPIMAGNGLINTANHLTEPVRGTLSSLGVDTSAAKIPKIPYQSEYGKKNGAAGEIGTEIGFGMMTAPSLLKTAAGKVLFGVSGSYNVASGAAGVDPTEKDENGNARQMETFERGMRIVSGAGEILGVRPSFSTAGKSGTTLAQESEAVEMLADTGTGVKIPVRVKNTPIDSAIEAATAKPTQSAEDLALEMRGEHRINIRKGDGTKSSGMEYAWRRHGGSGSLVNKSQFSISRKEVEAILQRKDVIKSPAILDATSGNYIRQVDVGKIVGNVPLKQGGHSTSVITIITDEPGNLVNVFPGRLDFGATLP